MDGTHFAARLSACEYGSILVWLPDSETGLWTPTELIDYGTTGFQKA
jgi:hypothetical protein